jgi:hypothetical protein
MTIEVTIPEGIVNTCKECGYDENKTNGEKLICTIFSIQ